MHEEPSNGALANGVGTRAVGDPWCFDDDARREVTRLGGTFLRIPFGAVEQRRREWEGDVDPRLRIPGENGAEMRHRLPRARLPKERRSEYQLRVVVHARRRQRGVRARFCRHEIPRPQVRIGRVVGRVTGERAARTSVDGATGGGVERDGRLPQVTVEQQKPRGLVRPRTLLVRRTRVGPERGLGFGKGARRGRPIVVRHERVYAKEAWVREERVNRGDGDDGDRRRRERRCDMRDSRLCARGRAKLGLRRRARRLTREQGRQRAEEHDREKPPVVRKPSLHRRGRHASAAPSSTAASAARSRS